MLASLAALVDTLFDAAPVAFGVVDRDLRYVRVNRMLAAIDGHTPEQMVGRTLHEVVPTLVDQLEPIYRRVLETGEPVVGLEVTGHRPNEPDEVGQWLVNYYPVRYQDEILGVGMVALDVTERRQRDTHQRLLAEAGRILSSRVTRDIMQRVAELAVPAFADWVVLEREADEGHRITIIPNDPQLAERIAEGRAAIQAASPGGMPSALARQSRQPVLVRVPDSTDKARPGLSATGIERAHAMGVRSVISVPLEARGELVGVASFVSTSQRRYDETDLAFAMELGRRTALALDNAALFEEAQRELAERQRTEAELRLSEERHRLVARAARDVIWDWDLRTDKVYTSEAMHQVFGHDPAEVERGTGWWMEHLHPDDRSRVWDEIQSLIARGDALWISEYRLRRADGTWASVTDRGWLLRDHEGRAIRMVGALSDVSDQRIRERNERLLAGVSETIAGSLDHEVSLRAVARLVVEHFADGCSIDLLDDDGNIEHFSIECRDAHIVDKVRELYEKYPPPLDAPVGYPAVIRTGEPELIESMTGEVLHMAASSPGQFELLREIGMTSVMCVPLRARGRTFGALTFVSRTPGVHFSRADLEIAQEVARLAALAADNAALFAAERHARAEAETANRAKADFLAVMSHELRTPLNAIGGYTELLRMGIRGPITEQQAEDLDRITRSQQALLGLINDVLNFARVEAGRLEVQRGPVSIPEVFATVEELIAPQLRAKNIAYHVADCPRDAVALGDIDKVRQIILNLMTNALKFTPSGGEVELSAWHDAKSVYVRVRDTGRGIPQDKLTKIFEPFLQLDTRRTREQDGVGLGLAISYEFAKAMGGDLRAESELGKGATFTLSLPSASLSLVAHTA